MALTVIGPAEALYVFKVAALLPFPETLPPVAVQEPTVTVALSGLVQLQPIVEDVPVGTFAGSAEHEIAGGFFGGSFTVKAVMQLASPRFFVLLLGSEIRAVTVYSPPATPFVSRVAASPLPEIVPALLVQV